MSTIAPIEETITQTSAVGEISNSILEQVLHSIRLRAQRRVLWLRKLWSEEEPPGGKLAVTHGEVDTLILDKDSPEAEREWFVTDPQAVTLTAAIKQVEREIAENSISRLHQLQQLFNLTDTEIDVVQTCLAISLDPGLARVYAYLQDQSNRTYATEGLVARLFQHGRALSLRNDSPLNTWRLIVQQEVGPGEPNALTCDPLIQSWLCGNEQLDQRLMGIAQVRDPLIPLANWPVLGTVKFIERLQNSEDNDHSIRIRVVGPVGSGRRTFAACTSAHLGKELLAIDSDLIAENDWSGIYRLAQRQACLSRYISAWHGDNALRLHWPANLPSNSVQFVICEPGEFPQPHPNFVEYTVEMPVLTLDERRSLLHHTVPASKTWNKDRVNALTARHRVTVAAIAALAHNAVETVDEADVIVRETTRQRLGDLVQVLDCPFDWDDLIVPDHIREELDNLVFEAKERASVWENKSIQRLFPQGRGLFALFAGATPGVGKTMAAQVVAKVLQRELYRIDLSSLISKYIGETTKNISRALSQVPNDEVLMFDEADSAFGRRVELSNATDANSHFLNADTNHLLQAVENYRGIVLLATNRKADIDPAFMRRLRYILDFTKPDMQGRLKIWQRVISEIIGLEEMEKLNNGLERLAHEVETTGAQIKLAVLSALFLSKKDGRELSIDHLVTGIERELRKEGRAWSERERQRLVRDVG